MLSNLCRHASRADADEVKVEAVMRGLKALVKAEAGLDAVIRSPALVCQSFASGGGTLLLSESEALLRNRALRLKPATSRLGSRN